MAAKEEILAATRALIPLRDNVGNFVLFEREVEEVLYTFFKNHRSDQNPIERVRHSIIEVGSIIAGEVNLWLKKLHRRLSPRMTARDPWTVQVTRDLPAEVFCFILESVKKATSRYGVIYSESPPVDCNVYTQENRVVRDLSRLCNIPRESILKYFSKKSKGPRKGNARVIVTAQKPFIVSYFRKGHGEVLLQVYK